MRISTSVSAHGSRCSEELGQLCPYPAVRNPSYPDPVGAFAVAVAELAAAAVGPEVTFRGCSWAGSRTLPNSAVSDPSARPSTTNNLHRFVRCRCARFELLAPGDNSSKDYDQTKRTYRVDVRCGHVFAKVGPHVGRQVGRRALLHGCQSAYGADPR